MLKKCLGRLVGVGFFCGMGLLHCATGAVPLGQTQHETEISSGDGLPVSQAPQTTAPNAPTAVPSGNPNKASSLPLPATVPLIPASAQGISLMNNANNDLCMGSNANAQVVLVNCLAPSSGSSLLRLSVADGLWRSSAARCLDVEGQAVHANANVVLSACNPNASVATQHWSLDKLGYLFFASNTTPSYCVTTQTATPATAAAGVALQLQPCSLAAVPWSLGSEGMALSYGADSNSCLSSSSVPTAGVELQTCGATSVAQRWNFSEGQLRSQASKNTCLAANALPGDPNKTLALALSACSNASSEAFFYQGLDGSLRLQAQPETCVGRSSELNALFTVQPCTATTVWRLLPY